MNKKFSAILLSGGSGSRLNENTPKQFLILNKKPIFTYSLELLIQEPQIKEIIIVYKVGTKKQIKDYIDSHHNLRDKKDILYTPGGPSRQKSVFNGLQKCNYENVILHETARPLITRELLDKVIKSEFDAVSASCPIPFTVLEKDTTDTISKILKRDNLVNIQLPQKFPTAKLLSAHSLAEAKNLKFTDDSSLYFAAGYDVHLIDGDENNLKITIERDLSIAEFILKEQEKKNQE